MSTNKKTSIVRCPSCELEMDIRELECSACSIQVRGQFGKGSRFDQLNKEQAAFLETFLRCRGVLRDVEASLGISYPTVRARLDALIVALDLAEPPSPKMAPEQSQKSKNADRMDILAALDAGSLDAAAAIDALNNMK